MEQVRKADIPGNIFRKIYALSEHKEGSHTDAALLIMGLVNWVYERDISAPFCARFPTEDNTKIFARLSADEDDTAKAAINKITKDHEEPADFGLGNEDGLFSLDISFTVTEEEGLEISAAFDDGKLAASKADTVINMYKNLASQIAEEPDKPLTQYDKVSHEEALRIIGISKGMELPVDRNKTWLDLFKENVKASPDALAVSADNGTYTYKELDEASDKLALSLIDRGVKPGDFILLKLDRVKEFVTAITGIHKAGCAYVPVDPAYPEERISFMTEDSGAEIILTEQDINSAVNAPSDAPVKDCLKQIPGADANGRAYMIYTSGSTGKPKGVMISHKSLMNFTASIRHLSGLNKSDRILAHRSFSFDAHIEDYFPVLSSGASVFILGEDKRKDTDEIVAFMRDNALTGGGFTTSVARVLMTEYELPLRYIAAGGEALYGITGRQSIQIINEYGPTECTDDSTWFPLEAGVSYNNVPIGRAMPNTYCFVLDKYGKLLPIGVAGELCVAGVQVGIGYHNRDELTRKSFTDCPILPGERMYHTGDLVKYNEDGVIEFIGRIDNQVKLRGYRIELGEIEAVAGSHDGIKETVALVSELYGSPHLILYYTARDGAVVDESRLRNFMDSSALPDYMKPEIYMRLDKMPLLPNAKIDRRHMPVPEYDADIKGEPPQTALETHLLNAAKEFLPGISFGVTDDMFSLGMTSLSAMRFAAKVNSLDLGVKYRVTDIMRYRTVRRLIAGNRRIFYNYGEYDKEKPMLVFVYGIAPVARTLQMLKLFNEAFNIFVIEATDSHYDVLFKDADYDDINDMYMAILENNLPEGCDRIDGFMGFSWGGYVSYTLAAEWAKTHGHKPFVVMGDSDFASKLSDEPIKETRLTDFPENLFELTGGAITQIEVVRKMNMVAKIDRTVKEIPKYDGHVIQLNALKIPDEEKESKIKNLEIMKAYTPDLEIIDFPEHDHNDLFYDESLIKKYIEIMTKQGPHFIKLRL